MPEEQESLDQILEKDLDVVIDWVANLREQKIFEATLEKLVEFVLDDSKKDILRLKALKAIRALPPHHRADETLSVKPEIVFKVLQPLLNLSCSLFKIHGRGEVIDGKIEFFNELIWTAAHLSTDCNNFLNPRFKPNS